MPLLSLLLSVLLFLPPRAHAETLSLEALVEGRLLLDGRWLVRPDTGQAQRLLYPTTRRHPEGGSTSLPMDVSPSGQVVLLDHFGGGLLLGLLDGVLFAHVALPTLVAPPAEASHAVVWLDDRHVLLYQSSRETGDSACVLLDAQTRAWQATPLPTCPATDFVQVWRIVRGPGDWLIVHSAAEGASTARMVRWDPVRGNREEVPLQIAPAAALAGGVEVFLVDNGFRVRAPCGLKGEGCTDSQDGWWLYDWLPSGDLRPLRDNLPVPAVPLSGTLDLAWGEEERFCIGDPVGSHRCFPSPDLR